MNGHNQGQVPYTYRRMLRLSQDTALDVRVLIYACKRQGRPKDLTRLSKQLRGHSSEDLTRSLTRLEEEGFLVLDPQRWRLTGKGKGSAIAIESSQKHYLYLLSCLSLCVGILLIVILPLLSPGVNPWATPLVVFILVVVVAGSGFLWTRAKGDGRDTPEPIQPSPMS